MAQRFKANWKTRTYFSIINQAKERGCGDVSHHILPRSMGGSDEDNNLVLLTHREHYIVHFLLTKMCVKPSNTRSMVYAFWRMNNSKFNCDQKVNSVIYEQARKTFVKTITGVPKSEEHKAAMRGKRPHVNQLGNNNNNFQGYYVTPWGTYASSQVAVKEAPVKTTLSCVINYCRYNNVKPIKKRTTLSLHLTSEAGLTPKDLGFYFVRGN